VVLQVIRRVGGERAQAAFLVFSICMRQLVLAKEELSEVALRALVALEAFLFEWILFAMCHRAVLFQRHNVAEGLITVPALVLLAFHVIIQMGKQSDFGIQECPAFVALEWHVRLLWNVDWFVRQLREDLWELSLYDPATRAGDGLAGELLFVH
jgi:hypothetical protein